MLFHSCKRQTARLRAVFYCLRQTSAEISFKPD
nr:MAG TPA: hypothetical protein [Caudoviricetes sp.]